MRISLIHIKYFIIINDVQLYYEILNVSTLFRVILKVIYIQRSMLVKRSIHDESLSSSSQNCSGISNKRQSYYETLAINNIKFAN